MGSSRVETVARKGAMLKIRARKFDGKGLARLGMARHGKVRQGEARHGEAW